MSYYAVLGVEPQAEFSELRRAYRRLAMACHPDLHGGDLGKAEDFRRLVEAFNVLTDPVKRRAHDYELGLLASKAGGTTPLYEMGFSPEDEGSILDTLADDILEELIVGNQLSPEQTTLATLMLDLERTEQLCLFREAKTHLYRGSTVAAEALFMRYVSATPGNILARYFLAKCFRANRKWRAAEKQLVLAIQIGSARTPPLQLIRIKRELAALRKSQPGLLGLWRRLFGPEMPKPAPLPVDVQERRALNRAINRLAMEREHRKKGPSKALRY